VLDVILGELQEIRKRHGRKRTTEITGEAVEFDLEELITPENVVVTMSHAGYLKRVPLATYRAQGRGGRGIIGADTREEDFVTQLWSAHTHDTLLFLTSRGRAFAKRVFEIPELSRTSAGRSIQNFLNLREGESITSAFALKDFDDRDILFASRTGIVKKVTLSLLRNAARQSGILACGLADGDSLVGAALLEGGEHVILSSAHGMAIRFAESDVRRMGRTARGVRGIRLRQDDSAVGLAVVRPGASLLTLCEGGYGKQTPLEDYRPQTRGGLGLKDIQTTKRNGLVVQIAVVEESDEIVLITAQGMIIRTRVSEISTFGRNTMGVKVINPKSGDRLLAGAVVEATPKEATGGATEDDADAATGGGEAGEEIAGGEEDGSPTEP
jgi:DNA gyrase subunit A